MNNLQILIYVVYTVLFYLGLTAGLCFILKAVGFDIDNKVKLYVALLVLCAFVMAGILALFAYAIQLSVEWAGNIS